MVDGGECLDVALAGLVQLMIGVECGCAIVRVFPSDDRCGVWACDCACVPL